MKIPSQPLPEWAVLIYSAASRDIEGEALASLQEVAAARQPDEVVVGAQLGTTSGTWRYRFTGQTEREMEDPPEQELPTTDMSDPASLEDFLRWGVQAFPARRHVLVLGGHGAAFVGSMTDPRRRKVMRLEDMAEALGRSWLHPQVVILNSCHGAQAEVALEFAPHADYLVASQDEEYGAGLPLGKLVERLAGANSPEEGARAAVEESAATPERTPSLAAVDLARSDDLSRALDGLGGAILRHPETVEALRGHIRALPHFRGDRHHDRPLTDCKDLAAFSRRLQHDPSLVDTSLPAAAREVEEATRLALVASAPLSDQGLSVYLPTEPLSKTHGALGERVEGDYRRLQIARTTAWDEALDLLTGRAASGRAPGAAAPALGSPLA